jgi:hypothetical protein
VTKVHAARALASRFGWRVWPATVIVDGACACGPSCCFTAPHPFGISGENVRLVTTDQVEMAWSAHPNAAPLLVADGCMDLVGADPDIAEGVLDFLDDNRHLARPTVISLSDTLA